MLPIRFTLQAILVALLAACAAKNTGDTVNAPVATEYDSTADVVEEVARLRSGPPFDGRCANMIVSMLFLGHEAAHFCGQITDAQGHNWALLESALYRLVEATALDSSYSRNVQDTRRREFEAHWSSLPDSEHERLCRVGDHTANFVRGFNVVVAKPMVEAYLSGIEAGLSEIAKNGLPADRERFEICGAL